MLRKLGVILKKMFFCSHFAKNGFMFEATLRKDLVRGEGIYVSVIFTNKLLKKNLKDKIRYAYEHYCSRLQI